LLGLLGTLALLGWIAIKGSIERPKAPAETPVYVASVPKPVETVVVAPAPVEELPPPAPPTLPPPKLEPDKAAIARAEAALADAKAARAQAETRKAEAEAALRKASLLTAKEATSTRLLASQVKDPTARIERATNQTAQLRWEIKKIKNEIASLDNVPRPKAKGLMDKSAVAKPIEGKEYHFEIRGNRVAHLDLDRLSEMVKTDIKLRVRMGTLRSRGFTGTVGPIGDFSMRYEVGMNLPDSLADTLDLGVTALIMKGWELVPENDLRGETLESLASPASSYTRVINRANPDNATITFWIYPDGYGLYRRLRDDLHAKGFLVAARPLPEGMSIRGSPGGSLSAGQ
jgi:hypothetical protein